MGTLNKKIGFIGGGQMGEAIIKGLISAGLFMGDDIYVNVATDKRIQYMTEKYGVKVIKVTEGKGYDIIVDECDIIVLAVKPQVLKGVLEAIKDLPLREEHLIISIVGGVKTSAIEKYADKTPVIRVMPNTPMLVNAGASGIALGSRAKEKDGELALTIFKALGIAYLVPEHLIDPLTSVSGCGPAYAYLMIEAMTDGGVEMGLTRDMATTLAAQTLMGAAKMVLETKEHPGKLKDNVCSPGGSTIAGVHALERGGFRGIVMNAVEAGKIRMEEVGKKAE
ncbi:pyrroline-5-carboxylate reductase [Oxobacter pfennigii]|uniref:Pyrroline-5-carboxylate reductase n=1 Tax=Oxobacter pfennigii TaxID=36849 RepID=A0A0P8YZZ7_9CLOT|nr:pyrroline-5-carboxylate reductase [Oxobacter pfennigii]KPU45459.1 pyrroline-5-carboxylate reductase [Oxobacter pfennigii]